MKPQLRYFVYLLLAGGTAFAQVSYEKEVAFGQQMVKFVESKYGRIHDDRVTGFAGQVMNKLSRNASLRLPLQVQVLDTSEPVASGLPGGFLLLSAGAIRGAETEAEFAALLAHAMGHVQAGPWVQTSTLNGAGIPLIFSGGWSGPCLRSGNGSASLVPASMHSSFDLQEVQADLLGVGYLIHASYDPQALVSVFERWRTKSKPDESLQVRTARLSASMVNPVVNTSAFEDVKARLAPTPTARRSAPSLSK